MSLFISSLFLWYFSRLNVSQTRSGVRHINLFMVAMAIPFVPLILCKRHLYRTNTRWIRRKKLIMPLVTSAVLLDKIAAHLNATYKSELRQWHTDKTMPDSENPRSYIRPVPLPIPSHQGLKITARHAKIYTCEVPTRKEVAKENYERRRHQMSKCGYRSVIYKPYQPVGEVYLDDKKLILSALGQEQSEQDNLVR